MTGESVTGYSLPAGGVGPHGTPSTALTTSAPS